MEKKAPFFAIVFMALAAGILNCSSDNEEQPTPLVGPRVWVADQPNSTVGIYDPDGNLLKSLGGSGVFSKPNAIDIYHADGAAWVCDFYTNRIRKYSADGVLRYTTPTDGEPLVRNATMLAVGQGSGECWVADRGHNRVIRLGADGAVLAKVTGFSFPRGVAVDRTAGDVWVADEMNDAVVKISGGASGDVNVGAVELGRYGGLNNPWAVAGDTNGAGWATSRREGTVVKLSAGANELASVAGFGEPVAVAVDEGGDAVYVVDSKDGALVALPRNIAGSYAGYGNVATFVVTALADPEYIFVDEDNARIYVAEMGAGRIRVYDRAGQEITNFGNFGGPAAVAAWPGR